MPHRTTRPAATAVHADPAGLTATLLPAATLTGVLPGLWAGFSTALPRVPNGDLAPLIRTLLARCWQAPVAAIPPPVLLRQTHSADVLELHGPDGAPARDATDGAAYDGVAAAADAPRLLSVKTADCVPLLAVDTELGRYAALHAGWRGAAGGILPGLLGAWRAAGSSLGSVRMELGPHIGGCCYEVQADCLAHFSPRERTAAVTERAGRSYLHLATLLQGQAVQAGVPPAHVHTWTQCTYCHRDERGQAPFASYRRGMHAGRGFTGTNVGLIGLRAGE